MANTYLMSTTIIPSGANGMWMVESLTQGWAATIASQGFISAVGHESTASIMAELLEVPVEANRITVQPEPGDRFLCFKLDQRPPEGAILDREQLQELGASWVLMQYVSR